MYRITQFLALLHARNLEFFRDTGSLAWAILFPVMVVAGCALAFSNNDKELYRVGVLQPAAALTASVPLLEKPWITAIHYSDRDTALKRLSHHQLDLLISQEESEAAIRYWINELSSEGDSLETLLQATTTQPLQRNIISGTHVRYVDWVMPGVLGMNIMFGSLFGVGYVVVRYRQNGVLKRIQATPVLTVQFLSAQVVSRLMIQMIAAAVILVGCYFALDLLILGSWWALLVTGLLGTLSMIAVGLMISSRTTSEEFAGGMLNLCTWPMMFLSGVWFSLDQAPHWMQQLANLLPLTHMVSAAREIMLEGASLLEVSDHLLILSAISVLLIGIASWRFRWHAAA